MTPETVSLNIDGMHCDACVRRVRAALSKVDGVEVKAVAVGSAQVEIDSRKATAQAAVEALNGIGFTAQSQRK